MKRITLETVDSTNNYIKEQPAPEGQEWLVVTTEFQTSGRGSASNSWESEKGRNLLFSIRFRPEGIRANQMFVLSQMMALAVCRTLLSYDKGFCIKWPNDIYHSNRKIVGMLIENDLMGAYVSNCVIGVGLNVNQTLFTSNAPNPVSLAQITGKEVQKEELLSRIIQECESLYRLVQEKAFAQIKEMYMGLLYRKGTLHTYRDAGGVFQGTITDVEPSGHLVVHDQDGNIRRYDFKEIEYILS